MTRSDSHTRIAWHGWRIDLPARWSAVKLEGDYDAGYALFADLHRPRLGVRWERPARRRKFDADRWIRRALVNEVGKLAADEAVAHRPPAGGEWSASMIYLEPQPPGRDVWLAYSETSRRALELIHHARRRERILADSILPSVRDVPCGESDIVPWSIFDLSLRLGGAWRLCANRLNAGDLSLTFTRRRQSLTVRQLAIAEIALKRQPLVRWLDEQQRVERKHYRAIGEVSDVNFDVVGRTLAGLRRCMRRRRRYPFMRWLPTRLITVALHDAARDRLVFVQGSDESEMREAVRTIGWASAEGL